MLSVNRSFSFLFPDPNTFHLSCLIAQSRTLSKMLKGSGMGGVSLDPGGVNILLFPQ